MNDQENVKMCRMEMCENRVVDVFWAVFEADKMYGVRNDGDDPVKRLVVNMRTSYEWTLGDILGELCGCLLIDDGTTVAVCGRRSNLRRWKGAFAFIRRRWGPLDKNEFLGRCAVWLHHDPEIDLPVEYRESYRHRENRAQRVHRNKVRHYAVERNVGIRLWPGDRGYDGTSKEEVQFAPWVKLGGIK